MEKFTVLPNKPITADGLISKQFLTMGIDNFHDACCYVHRFPYGYNSNRDDLMILFKEKMGTCTTKHAVIATLAAELGLPITKSIGIYAMNEILVSGTGNILRKYNLPYVPMLHCFLEYSHYRVDLTEGNQNGKNRSIENFLHTVIVKPDITEKEEYALYRSVLNNYVLTRNDMDGVDLKTILHARSEGIILLKSKIESIPGPQFKSILVYPKIRSDRMETFKVLFICVHNSGRSQMAEAFLKSLAGETFQVESAGLDPQPIQPLVIAAMKEDGYDLSNKTSDSVFDFYREGRLYDYVITVCDKETELQCPVFAGLTQRLHWPFPDPAKLSGPPEEKLKVLREIRDQIKLKVEAWFKEIKDRI